MRIGLAQIRPRLGRVDINLELHEEMIHQAREEQVDLLIFPELSLTGYNLLDLTYEMARDPFSPDIQRLIQAAGEMDLVFGFVEHSPEHTLYNSAAYITQQNLHYLHRKVYLPTYGMFDEARYFGHGQMIRSIPTRFGQVGIQICEDAWHPSTAYLLAQDGAQILIIPSNSPARNTHGEGLGSQEAWVNIMKTQAMSHGCYVLFANRVGTEDGVSFFGGSAVVDPFGEVEKQASLFKEELLIADLEIDKVRKARFQMPMLRDENLDITLRELNRIKRKRSGEGTWL
ncbi:nitrilase-related carbon-nitrogen hydrolase [Laceyella putida]|uniref:Nitrilase-related carbon-nitrogen hydrolase n=1 Tax=Laceyella putida TaxID=110101 RepID=A0ABW2RIH9_9BACL